MKFQRVLEQVYCKPWLITPAGWDSIDRLVSARLTSPTAERPTEDFFGDPLPVMRIDGRTAIIPVEGIIGRKLGLVEKSCGAVDCMDIEEDLRKAMADPRVKHIVLDVNSPGGSVSGVPELAQLVAEFREQKNIVAIANDQMCSAAYWISAGANRIYASASSCVGSIGVFVPWIDRSAAYEANGLKVDIIKAGKYKGMGYPGTSLTDDQRGLIQDDVDETYAEFTGFVKTHRTRAKDEAMQGQAFSGKAAREQGLVTNLISGLDELLRQLNA